MLHNPSDKENVGVVSIRSEDNGVPLKNAAVKVGNQMSMRCGSFVTNCNIHWKFKGMTDRNARTIYDGTDGYVLEQMEGDSGRIFTLIKYNTQLEDAGTYSCYLSSDKGLVIYRSELVVLC